MSKNQLLLAEFENYLSLKYTVVREYKFHPKRKFRFDYALTSDSIAIEVEGGIYSRGRHTRGSGYQTDMYKYNLATSQGWRLYRFSYTDLEKLTYKEFI